ncbi:DUF3943 domain-containing protein [Sulfuricurvum sp.]|uniref:DUF3943 domain-containing protein n=1 Tax=Sulfuricurvum sp. TaxID=2025608 RepID=UPI003C70F3DC
MTIAIRAEGTLYDHLKTHSDLQKPVLFNFSAESVSGEDMLSRQVHLKEPFQRLDEGKDYSPASINLNEQLSSRYKRVIEDSIYLQLLMLSSIGVLSTMPESITNWNTEKLQEQSLYERWDEHISTTPVWDNDDWVINYIGHPVSGAFYYTMARNDGMSMGESAAFSALMSTFFWEYGYESFAEVPSIQDLIVTPLFGSILGEGMFVLEKKLDQQGGVVFGSTTLGNISYFLLDPLGSIADWMRNTLILLNLEPEVTMTFRTYPYAAMHPFPFTPFPEDSIRVREREYGFIITFQ